jgi:CRP/FNR family transcriptional regulator, cyclic AMP receptor protein
MSESAEETFAGLGEPADTDCVRMFCDHAAAYTFPAGAELLAEGAAVSEVYLIGQGLVKVARTDEQGHEVIHAIRGPGAILGACPALSRRPTQMSASTLTRCQVYRLSAAEFRRMARTDGAFAYGLLLVLCRRAADDTAHQIQLSTPDARTRLLLFLAQFLADGLPLKSGETQLHIPLKDHEIARYLIVDRTTLSKLYRRLAGEGILRRHKGWTIIIKSAALQPYVPAIPSAWILPGGGRQEAEMKD